ncbi:PVC-type heme-binding CxxCH protein [Gimesia maris]|uniref:PVC-type heme-binding CxxCH protein n=1 Tax=Gimesia maris TaxID=122 RepID=UPI00241ECE0C|nr:PVC-type heme-binding CxxCH protein [Gimesia maris]|tara:strand:+ start:4599 stop:7607 length:3009 start_codon:yes stop_codon:yes gene_type:complete
MPSSISASRFRLSVFAFALISILLTGLTLTVQSADKTESKPKVDYSAEMPRILPLTPEEAVKSFKIHPDFEIQLVAAEPLVRDPVAMCFDARGRAYVVEMPEYNDANQEGYSSVKLLEDTDGDGRFDKSYPFLSDMTLPTAVFSYKGGVFVGAPPYVYYCKDTDCDRIADVREVVMTGFGRDKGDEGMINSFRWGLDNKIHFSTGIDGGNVTLAADKEKKVYNTKGRGVILDPETRTIELTTGGGQHGMSLGNWNREFVCANSIPMQVLMYDDRYIARNPYLAPPAAPVSIAPGGKFTKLLRISQVEPWRVLRSRIRAASERGDYEKGQPSGFFTAATGITVYRGGAWPAEYQGNLFVGEPANNLVYRAAPQPDGLSLVAPRADQDAEFLASTDVWFRPVQFENGPEGALYVLDMYRELIEGAPFIPEEVIKHLDPVGGQDKGRIYRIVPKGFQQPEQTDLTKLSSQALVELLESDNGWTRDTAQRLLYERQDTTIATNLKQLATGSTKPITRATALWSLQALGSLDSSTLLKGLQDKEFQVRKQSLKIAEQYADAKAIQQQMISLAADPSLEVQYQAAFSLGAFESSARNAALADLLKRHAANQWIRMAVQSSLDQGAGEVFEFLIKNNKSLKEKQIQQFLVALAVQIGAQQEAGNVKRVLAALEALPESHQKLAEILFRNLLSRASNETKQVIAKSDSDHTAKLLKGMMQSAIVQATNDKAAVKARVEAIPTLSIGPFDETQPVFEELLSVQQPLPVRQRAITALGLINDDRVAELLIEAWPGLSPQLRMSAVETLFSRKPWLVSLLEAVKAGDINPGDIGPERVQLLKKNQDKAVKKMAESLFHNERLTGRSDVIKDYQSSLKLKGDAASGKLVFKKSCSACHRLENVGVQLGADLKAIKDRGTEAVLLNILDPNREVKPQYVTYLLVTTQGRTITGLIKEENANSITIARADGTSDTVLRIDIDELISSRLSFMPEGLEKQINKQEMADLLAYLNSIK